MTELVVMDTVNVFLKRKSDGHLVARTRTQMGSIAQTVGEERLKGSIGNQTIAVLNMDKEIEVTFRNALFDLEYLSMTQGVGIVNKAVTIKKSEELIVVDNLGSLEVTIVGTPAGATVSVFDTDGTNQEVAHTSKVVEIPVGYDAVAGDKILVVYNQTATGDVVEFDSKTFSELYELEMTTICYNPDSMVVEKDLYIQFDSVKPSSAFDLSFESGSAIAPELSLTVLTPKNSSIMGRIFTVDRIEG